MGRKAKARAPSPPSSADSDGERAESVSSSGSSSADSATAEDARAHLVALRDAAPSAEELVIEALLTVPLAFAGKKHATWSAAAPAGSVSASLKAMEDPPHSVSLAEVSAFIRKKAGNAVNKAVTGGMSPSDAAFAYGGPFVLQRDTRFEAASAATDAVRAMLQRLAEQGAVANDNAGLQNMAGRYRVTAGAFKTLRAVLLKRAEQELGVVAVPPQQPLKRLMAAMDGGRAAGDGVAAKLKARKKALGAKKHKAGRKVTKVARAASKLKKATKGKVGKKGAAAKKGKKVNVGKKK
jgi:hypothetical protein